MVFYQQLDRGDGGILRGRDGDEIAVDNWWFAVSLVGKCLAQAPHCRTVRVQHRCDVPIFGLSIGRRYERRCDGVGAGGFVGCVLVRVQALVVEVAEDHQHGVLVGGQRGPGSAAVLDDTTAHVPRILVLVRQFLGENVDRAVRRAAHEGDPAAFLGVGLIPPHLVSDVGGPGGGALGGGDGGGVDRGWPGSVRWLVRVGRLLGSCCGHGCFAFQVGGTPH